VTRHTEHDAHAALSTADWQRMRAGFAVQGPYRRQSRRVGRWLLAFFIVGVLIVASF